MSQSVYLVPAEGLNVRHPLGGYLNAAGDQVVLDSYWRRRIADESVTEGSPTPEAMADEPLALAPVQPSATVPDVALPSASMQSKAGKAPAAGKE